MNFLCPLIIFPAFFGPTLAVPTFSFAGGSRSRCSTPQRPHKGRVEVVNPPPLPASHPSFDAAQDTIGFLGCKRTISSCQTFNPPGPPGLFLAGLLSVSSPRLCMYQGLPRLKCNTLQHLAGGLIESQ